MADIRLLFNKSSAKTKRRKIDSEDNESAESSSLLGPTSDIDDGHTRELARVTESVSKSDLVLDPEDDCCEVDVAGKSDSDCEIEQAEDSNDNTSASVSGKV
jgi:hypothetical protein